ncbi:nuclear transport factor 2 family protein [Nocardiopsis alba]|uniref:nuclear transport factor 2 family protein n=1 Tax=Nocardiopsis alba TaxID=53437 RepID=UPI0033C9E5CB
MVVRMNGETAASAVAGFISIWNERDPKARRAAGERVLAPNVVYVDPEISAEGLAAFDAYVDTWQRSFPGMNFHFKEVRAHHDLVHFEWGFGRPGGEVVAEGWDAMTLGDQGIARVYGFFA